jgi:hypothetical protein
MNTHDYRKQVSLLLSLLPLVARENSFALHGGTAINLFHHNRPRLSIDIELTWLPVEDRDASMTNINQALDRIRQRILNALPDKQRFSD